MYDIKRDMLVIMTATNIAKKIRPECMNAAEIIGAITEALAARELEIHLLQEALYECANLATGWTDLKKEAPELLQTIYGVACTATGEKSRDKINWQC